MCGSLKMRGWTTRSSGSSWQGPPPTSQQVKLKDLQVVFIGEVQHHALKAGYGLPQQEEGVLLVMSSQGEALALNTLSLSRF